MPCHCHKSFGLEIVISRRCWLVQSYVEEREREREREKTFFGSFASCMRKKQAHKVSDMDAGHLVAADLKKIKFLWSQMQMQVCSYFLMVHQKLQSLSGVNYVIKT